MTDKKKKNNKKTTKKGGRFSIEGFEQKVLELIRVTRVTEGGKQLSFRACVGIGDGKGKLGLGVAKGKDVSIAISKAVRQANKNIITIPLINETIPHEVVQKFGAAKVLIKPAKNGRGIKAGGVVRVLLELAGVPNVIAKIQGCNNKINNAKALMKALQSFKS